MMNRSACTAAFFFSLLLIFMIPLQANASSGKTAFDSNAGKQVKQIPQYDASGLQGKSSLSVDEHFDISGQTNAAGSLIAANSIETIAYHKNGKSRFYPSSTTKIMTLYTALKHGNLDEEVLIPVEAVDVPYDSSLAEVRPGEKMSLETLLYGLMLPSGNDAAVATAHHISGSTEKFMELVNDEAAAMGAEDTHFVNPHGYHDPEHYTTPYDLALMMFELLKQEDAEQFLTTHTYKGDYTDPFGENKQRVWTTTNEQIYPVSKSYSPFVTGGKTGYTSQARYNLVSFTNAGGNLYVTAAMRGGKENRYTDTAYLVTSALAETEIPHSPVEQISGFTFWKK
ncbi:D-alanyl-D-alanine carboxypeptidase family protein [Alkalicoccus halolimnae]|uniref:Serine hydrolase n=1 Tax=Alkalicoccus halolimnae TaxID=1667239 RepID=A0A5C7F6H4_9BACI|nr:serine hydrolase [Alkalicoccus halolimnae]TXF85613.1 D-alanyl-D-alanine carboxypeptidase [Alkalicoccus halolimnae]